MFALVFHVDEPVTVVHSSSLLPYRYGGKLKHQCWHFRHKKKASPKTRTTARKKTSRSGRFARDTSTNSLWPGILDRAQRRKSQQRCARRAAARLVASGKHTAVNSKMIIGFVFGIAAHRFSGCLPCLASGGKKKQAPERETLLCTPPHQNNTSAQRRGTFME